MLREKHGVEMAQEMSTQQQTRDKHNDNMAKDLEKSALQQAAKVSREEQVSAIPLKYLCR